VAKHKSCSKAEVPILRGEKPIGQKIVDGGTVDENTIQQSSITFHTLLSTGFEMTRPPGFHCPVEFFHQYKTEKKMLYLTLLDLIIDSVSTKI
jgi:hypothetical protein